MEPSSHPVPEIAVVMLTMNQKNKTLRCLESFREVREPPYRTLLWDNGSADGTMEAVSETYPEVLCCRSPVNLGAASGRNRAAKRAMESFDPRYLLFIDNDTVVTPGFLTALIAPFRNDRELGQTSAKIRYLKDPGRLNAAGGARINFIFGSTKVTGVGEIDEGQHDEPGECIANGGCTLVRRDIFEKIGGFDSRFDPYGYEDLDFSLRIRKSGFGCLYVPSSIIYHDPSRTYVGEIYNGSYAAQKAKTGMLMLSKHASIFEKAGFILVGLPYSLARVLFREGRKGNLEAIGGLWRGAANFLRPTRRGE